VLILGIETSCDDTAAAVVEDGKIIRGSVVSSQVELHAKYGGIVPEVASRAHIENVLPVIHEALALSRLKLKDINAVSVTVGPGLIGALLVGVSAAKALAYTMNVPLIGVNHIEGHLSAIFLESDEVAMPFVLLVVSGGHSHLYLVRDYCVYEKLGQTRDDAAGEAYDKVAKLLGLGYPGGPVIDNLAGKAEGDTLRFTRSYLEPGSLDFSFSGLKTAVLNYVRGLGMAPPPVKGGVINPPIPPLARGGKGGFSLPEDVVIKICASFQAAVVDVLVKKTVQAAKLTGVENIVVAGGVASNSALRAGLTKAAGAEGKRVFIPSPPLCTDNAAMVAAAGYHLYKAGKVAGLDLNPQANLPLERMHI
jgi:N6-L-threonylcarbamoyladenine synthase